MDRLHAAGKLETYLLEQRLKDTNDPPRCECGTVLDVPEGELCSKCEGEAYRLAHRIHQRRAPDRRAVATVEGVAASQEGAPLQDRTICGYSMNRHPFP